MTKFSVRINDKKYLIKCLSYNITTKSYKMDTEKLQTWEKLLFLVRQGLQTSHSSNVSWRNLLQRRLWACTKQFEKLTLPWLNPKGITLNRPGDNKAHLRPDSRCKWTAFSLQEEHFITTIFWIPLGSPLQVRLLVVENLLAIIFIRITIRTEEFANFLVTLRFSRTLDKREN